MRLRGRERIGVCREKGKSESERKREREGTIKFITLKTYLVK